MLQGFLGENGAGEAVLGRAGAGKTGEGFLGRFVRLNLFLNTIYHFDN